MPNIPIITESMVSKALNYSELIPAIEQALALFSRGKIVQPLRQTTTVKKHNGFLMSMCAFDEKNDAMSLKLISLYPDNHLKGFPSHQCRVMHFEAATGALLAIIEAETLTHFRTAAASAVATKYLASPSSKILAVLGAGDQARSHLYALTTLANYDKIFVWNRTEERGRKLVEEVKHLAPTVRFCSTVREAVSDADVVTTCTTAYEPILQGAWLKDGAHINSVGGCRPNWREMDDDCMNMCDVYVDSYEGSKAESGDIILSKKEVSGELGEVIMGIKQPVKGKNTIFKSLGMAAWDVAAASLVWQKYKDGKIVDES